MNRKIITVVIGATLGLGVGALIGYGPMLRYKSEGILSMEMGTAEYKRFTELANDETTIRKFIAMSPPAKLNDKKNELLISSIVKGEWHKPVAKINKADAKELPDIVLLMEKEVEKEKEKEKEKAKEKDKSEDKNSKKTNAGVLAYLGLKVTNTNADPNTAAEVAGWMGGYFKDVAVREAIREQVSQWVAESKQFSDRALEQKLKFQFEIDQAKERTLALKKVLASYPESAGVREGRQIVEVRKDNEKFLSPMAQIIAAESEIITNKEKIQKLNREIEQQIFAASIVKTAETIVKKAHGGIELMSKLNAIVTEQGKNVKNDAEREKLLSLTADLSQITARFISQAEFIAQPSIPSHAERPTPSMYMAILGFLFAVFAMIYCWRLDLLRFIREKNAHILKSNFA
jgi:hypothetical protein